jgi:alpha-L-fucosidase 2
VKGFKARGNIFVDITWENGRATEVVLSSPKKQTVAVIMNQKTTNVSLPADEKVYLKD